jgi:transposase InsO family protein|tara:strand:+ start:377 stop:1213 length:837 start_codon:yes stop_codon:yes gene_type:complete
MKLAAAYPVTLVCQSLDYPRSRYYYQAKVPADQALREALASVAADWPTYGYRRVTAQLRRQGWRVNAKRVRRLMGALGLTGKPATSKRRTTNSAHPFPRYPNLVVDLEVVAPEHVWVADITYIKLARERVYLAVIMDVFTRCIRGWHLGRSLGQELTIVALQRGLAAHTPAIHHSDQGVQYAATVYTQLLQAANVQISMAAVGQAWQNGYAERLVRTIKEEEVDLSEYEDYRDAYAQIGQFLEDVYMHKRIHSALGYLTPVEFENHWLTQPATPEAVH